MVSGPHVWALCLLASVVLSYSASAAAQDLVVSKLERKIDLQTHSVRISATIKLENKGANSFQSFVFLLPRGQSDHLAFIKAVAIEGKQKSRSFTPLNLEPTETSSGSNITEYSVALPKALGKGDIVNLELYYVLTNVVKPFPAEISQADPQLLLFEDSHYGLSAYPVKSQVTVVRLPNGNVESFTKKDPSKQSDLDLKFGPYENVNAFEFSPLTIHYENNIPLVEAEHLEREIEISHWGNIYVTENYRIKHAGALHKGSFSRFDFQSRPMASGVASLRGLVARLPPRAHSVYYRDEIGNISTSHLRSDLKKTELELEPRYPLMGGWSVTFTLGYSLPLEDFVFRTSDGRRALNITFGSSFAEIVVHELIVKVVLPEGSSNLQVEIPFHVEQAQEEKFTYLDTVGRPVVVLKRKNVVAELNVQNFAVLYSFSPIAQLVEPLILVIAFLLFFLTCVIYVRADFTISRHTPTYLAKMQQEEVLDALQRLQKVISQRTSATEKLDVSLHALSRSGNVVAAKTARKTAEATLRDSSKDLKTITDALEAMQRPPSVLPKVQALVSKEKERQVQALQKHQVMVEAYERKQSAKEIDQRVAPIQQKFVALNKEVKELLLSIEDA